MAEKCTVQQVMKVITRSSAIPAESMKGEHRLMLGIISQAVADLSAMSSRDRNSAISFFNSSEDLELVCSFVEIEPEGVVRILKQGGFIPAQPLRKV